MVGVVAPGSGLPRERERHARLDGQPRAVEAAGSRIADREAAERAGAASPTITQPS